MGDPKACTYSNNQVLVIKKSLARDIRNLKYSPLLLYYGMVNSIGREHLFRC